jgi:hypothetical protein
MLAVGYSTCEGYLSNPYFLLRPSEIPRVQPFYFQFSTGSAFQTQSLHPTRRESTCFRPETAATKIRTRSSAASRRVGKSRGTRPTPPTPAQHLDWPVHEPEGPPTWGQPGSATATGTTIVPSLVAPMVSVWCQSGVSASDISYATSVSSWSSSSSSSRALSTLPSNSRTSANGISRWDRFDRCLHCGGAHMLDPRQPTDDAEHMC